MRRSLIFALFSMIWGVVIIACQGVGAPTSKPTVIIASPPSGSVYAVGEEVVVQSTSTDPAGIVSVALLVDGAQVREDPSPVTQGQVQFSLIQSWVAESAGQHTVTVRSTNAQGASSESAILINVRAQPALQPTTISAIATAVPLATFTATPPANSAQPTNAPTANPAITVVVTATSAAPTAVPPNTAAPTCVLSSKFVADLTIPDGTSFTPNAVFNKSWRVQNNGTCAWENFSLAFVNGTQMAASNAYPAPVTQPGATADLLVPMSAPANYGNFTGTWRLRDVNGNLFGTNLTVVIKVPAPATIVPPTNTPPPTIAGCSGQPNDFAFNASANAINPGQSVNLSWSAVSNASAVYLSGGDFGPEPGQGVETPGNRTTAPGATTTYKLKAVCNNSGQSREKSITVTVNPGAGNFAGEWEHNFGTMTLTQSGNTVTGTYHNASDGENGVIAGIVNGNVLTGTYTKNQTLPIQFNLSNDGKRFTGNWNGTNQWCGARPGESFPGGCAFDGKWKTKYGAGETACDMELNQVGTSITGTYCNGSITGNISFSGGNAVLNGTWKFPAPSLNQGPFAFYLPVYTSSQFRGNYSGNQWCGWRSGESAPAPCNFP